MVGALSGAGQGGDGHEEGLHRDVAADHLGKLPDV